MLSCYTACKCISQRWDQGLYREGQGRGGEEMGGGGEGGEKWAVKMGEEKVSGKKVGGDHGRIGVDISKS